jgi:hypothetical protein
MTTAAGNNARLAFARKKIDLNADTLKIILMATGYTFNPVTHDGYADVSASELAEANGYLRNTKTLAGVTFTENGTLNRCEITFNTVSWTAAGGVIGPTPGAIIFDDTVAAADGVSADVVLGYINFGGDKTQADGGTLSISNIMLVL